MSFLLYHACFQSSWGTIPYLYLAEIMTDKGLSLGNFVIAFLTFLSAAVFPFIDESIVNYVWFLFGFFMVVAAFFVQFLVKETRGLCYEDSQKLYQNNFKQSAVSRTISSGMINPPKL